jgi:hypothetical protein
VQVFERLEGDERQVAIVAPNPDQLRAASKLYQQLILQHGHVNFELMPLLASDFEEQSAKAALSARAFVLR